MAHGNRCDLCRVEFSMADAIESKRGPGARMVHGDRKVCQAYQAQAEKGIKIVIGRGSMERDPRMIGEAKALPGHFLEVYVDGKKLTGQGVSVIQTKGKAPAE